MSRQAGQGMRICPYCAEEIRAEAIKCRYCGERLEAAGSAPPPPAAPTGATAPDAPISFASSEPADPAAPTADGPALGAMPGNLPSAIYRPDFDLDSLPAPTRRAAMKHTFERRLPVWLAIVLSILTMNIFFVVNYSVKHGRLPKLVSNDPGEFKAFVLLFMPIFNAYWIFFMWMRLADRMNLQLRLRGLPARPNRALPAVAATLMFAGMLGAGASMDFFLFTYSLTWLVLVPLFVSQLQEAINDLIGADAIRQAA